MSSAKKPPAKAAKRTPSPKSKPSSSGPKTEAPWRLMGFSPRKDALALAELGNHKIGKALLRLASQVR